MRHLTTAVFFFAALVALPGTSHAVITGKYTVYKLPVPSGTISSSVLEINNVGQVVGRIDYVTPEGRSWYHGVLWNGTVAPNYREFPEATLRALNDSGFVVGQDHFLLGGTERGFLAGPPDYGLRYDINLRYPTAVSNTMSSGSPDIAGFTTGWTDSRTLYIRSPYLINRQDFLPDPVSDCTGYGQTWGINSNASPMVTGFFDLFDRFGQCTSHAFRYESGDRTFVDVDQNELSTAESKGFGVNDLGDVVGYRQYSVLGGPHAILWFKDGVSLNLGDGNAYDVNNHRSVVGGGAIGGKLFMGRMGDGSPITFSALDVYIDSSSGWHITAAVSINERDQIVADAEKGGSTFAVLLSPCGDGTVDPGEECDDGNVVDGDGCESHCTLTPRTGTDTFGAGGGTVRTGGVASPSDPVQVTVTTPNAGTVSIAINGAGSPPPPPTGFGLLGAQVEITAAPAPATNPLVIVFRLDASIIPPGWDEKTITVTKNGNPILKTCSTPGVAAPDDPCVAPNGRVRLGDGDVQITVLSTTASWWGAAVGDICGDNLVNQPTEQCDGTDDAVCPGRCIAPGDTGACTCSLCGNGLPDPGETCDDGNTVSGCRTDQPQKPLDDCKNDCTRPICKDPSRIDFRESLDRIRVHGRIEPGASQSVLDANGKGLTLRLSSPDVLGGIVFQTNAVIGMSTSAIHDGNGRYKYTNRSARSTGGISYIMIRKRGGSSYAVTIEAYGNLRSATSPMKTHVTIGDEEWTVTTEWFHTAQGWRSGH